MKTLPLLNWDSEFTFFGYISLSFIPTWNIPCLVGEYRLCFHCIGFCLFALEFSCSEPLSSDRSAYAFSSLLWNKLCMLHLRVSKSECATTIEILE